MPVIPHKKTVDVDSYGFFAGFGANEIVAPTDQFEGWPSLDAKRAAQAEIKKLILVADTAIYEAYNKMPGVFSTIGGMVIPGGPLVAFLSKDVRDRIKQGADDRAYLWEAGKKLFWEMANFGTITADGVTRSATPKEFEASVKLIGTQISGMKEVLELANNTTVTALLTTSVKDVVVGVLEVLNQAADLVKTTIAELLKIAKSNIEKASWFARNWLWVALGGIAVFYVLPSALKSIRAYRGGGFDAGSAALEEEIRGARQAASDAASKAAALARKAGTAYATGNPATLMAGMKRRRARRRR